MAECADNVEINLREHLYGFNRFSPLVASSVPVQ
jgi:hypothetical protein